jgi:uncharacterized protein (DUF433 family)
MTAASYPLPTPLVTISNDWLGGEPCFTGRRVPVQALFDYLKCGDSLDDFLDDFPSVSREHAQAILARASSALVKFDAAE